MGRTSYKPRLSTVRCRLEKFKSSRCCCCSCFICLTVSLFLKHLLFMMRNRFKKKRKVDFLPTKEEDTAGVAHLRQVRPFLLLNFWRKMEFQMGKYQHQYIEKGQKIVEMAISGNDKFSKLKIFWFFLRIHNTTHPPEKSLQNIEGYTPVFRYVVSAGGASNIFHFHFGVFFFFFLSVLVSILS